MICASMSLILLFEGERKRQLAQQVPRRIRPAQLPVAIESKTVPRKPKSVVAVEDDEDGDSLWENATHARQIAVKQGH